MVHDGAFVVRGRVLAGRPVLAQGAAGSTWLAVERDVGEEDGGEVGDLGLRVGGCRAFGVLCVRDGTVEPRLDGVAAPEAELLLDGLALGFLHAPQELVGGAVDVLQVVRLRLI